MAKQHEEKQEPPDDNGDSCLNLMGCVRFEEQVLPPADLESGFAEASKEDNKEHVLVAVQNSRTVVPHGQKTFQRISDNKMVEILTSHIKEILLHFLPACSLSREEIMCMSPEDIITMFRLKAHSEHNETETLYFNQYLSQYEGQLLEKIQSVRQQSLHTVHATETKIGLYEAQIKAEEEKLEHLRSKIAQLLLKLNPHLLINNLEDVDSYLEQSLQPQENLGISHVNIDSTEFGKSAVG